MLEHVTPDVGDHPLAEPVDAVEARGAGEGEDQADADQGDEIFVDEARIDAGEAEIDHASHGKRHGERRGRRDDEREQCRAEHAPMTQEIWPEREQRANRGALAFPTLCRARNRIPPAAVGAVKFWCCELHYRPSEFFQGTDFKSLGPRRKGPFTAPFRRSLVPG